MALCAVTAEMETSPDKRHKAPRSAPQNDQQQVAARQERFMQQMLHKTGEAIFSSGRPLCVVPFCERVMTHVPW